MFEKTEHPRPGMLRIHNRTASNPSYSMTLEEPSQPPQKENRYPVRNEHRKYWSDITICGFDGF
ncbi:MAG: hypothetical protein K8R40_09345 [Anaerolineaceae bacterium]|nr:hypothetical protein [Anaerolineaceae bacterium]